MSTINSLSSSGQYVNIDALVQNAVRLQQQRVSTLQSQKNSLDTQISSLGKVKSLILGLEDKFKAIGSASDVFTIKGAPAEATINATQSGKFSISVSSLSASQIISSQNSIPSSALGYSGSITINKGSYDLTGAFTSSTPGTPINIVASDTLSIIAKKINDSNIGVNANIINASDGQHLSFSGAAGAVNGFEITTQDNTNSGLSFFNYNQTNTNSFNNVTQAKDGVATIDGIKIFSKDNSFKANDGFSFKATKEFSNQVVTVEKDDSVVSKALEEFVSAYNATTASLKDMGIDYQFKSLTNKLRTELGKGDYNTSLNNIGMSFDKNGLLSFNKNKFTTYSQQNGDTNKLKTLLDSKFGKNSAGLDLLKNTTESDGFLATKMNILSEQSKKIINTISANKDLLSTQVNAYQKQFAQLDQYLAQLNSSSGSLSALGSQISNQA